jgi:hypothetical protein
MCVILPIAGVGVKKETAQDAPGATIVISVDLQASLIFNVRLLRCSLDRVETFRAIEDDMDAMEISHRTRDSHSVHIDHFLLEQEEQKETKNKNAQTNCPRDRIRFIGDPSC